MLIEVMHHTIKETSRQIDTVYQQQAIGNIAMDLAHQIRSKYQNLSQPWIKAAQELRQPYVF
jgi:hypothetical protein